MLNIHTLIYRNTLINLEPPPTPPPPKNTIPNTIHNALELMDNIYIGHTDRHIMRSI